MLRKLRSSPRYMLQVVHGRSSDHARRWRKERILSLPTFHTKPSSHTSISLACYNTMARLNHRSLFLVCKCPKSSWEAIGYRRILGCWTVGTARMLTGSRKPARLRFLMSSYRAHAEVSSNVPNNTQQMLLRTFRMIQAHYGKICGALYVRSSGSVLAASPNYFSRSVPQGSATSQRTGLHTVKIWRSPEYDEDVRQRPGKLCVS